MILRSLALHKFFLLLVFFIFLLEIVRKTLLDVSVSDFSKFFNFVCCYLLLDLQRSHDNRLKELKAQFETVKSALVVCVTLFSL